MAALSQLLPTPTLGQLYPTFDALKKNVQDWAVREKFHYEISHKDKERVLYCCKYHDMDELGCDWRLRGNITDEGDIKITSLEFGHTCIVLLVQRLVAATQEWLQVYHYHSVNIFYT